VFGKMPAAPGPALDRLIQPLRPVGGFEMLAVRQGQPVAGQGLADIVLDPIRELRVLRGPLRKPTREIPLGFSRSRRS
jgi:hypothetical protein